METRPSFFINLGKLGWSLSKYILTSHRAISPSNILNRFNKSFCDRLPSHFLCFGQFPRNRPTLNVVPVRLLESLADFMSISISNIQKMWNIAYPYFHRRKPFSSHSNNFAHSYTLWTSHSMWVVRSKMLKSDFLLGHPHIFGHLIYFQCVFPFLSTFFKPPTFRRLPCKKIKAPPSFQNIVRFFVATPSHT